jgi:hypothetical protein
MIGARHILRGCVCGAVLAACLTSSFAAPAKADKTEKKEPSGGNARLVESLVSITARVQAIDLATREVTVKGPLGNEITFTVGDDVKRLNEIKVGDDVVAEYYLGMAAELRAPTPEEKAQPLVVLESNAKASMKEAPAGATVRVLRVVATIEGLDRPSESVTLKGPGGRYVTARVADPSMLMKPRLGDTVVVTVTEALAVSLEKVQH